MEFQFLNRVTCLVIILSLVAVLGAAWLRTY
jgi:hypothetical protein